jgi:hypothetical protein
LWRRKEYRAPTPPKMLAAPGHRSATSNRDPKS